jgi:beta-phosphoglucomutase family hydrolase
VRAFLFDLDGVLTDTASVHSAAWKEMFDEVLSERAKRQGEPFVPFTEEDYARYVDGRPRLEGTREFLRSRHIDLPEGDPSDPSGTPTVHGLGNRKNDLVQVHLTPGAVRVFDGSVAFVRAVRAAGGRTAVVSSSANTLAVLRAVGIEHLFDARIDGVVAEQRQLAGKPAPDTFLAAAEDLGVEPGRAAVFEDALAGVEAGRRGTFALVVGVNRGDADQAEALRAHGADVVVGDLSELLTGASGPAVGSEAPRRPGDGG